MNDTPASTVVEFPRKPGKTVSSHERIWGKPVLSHGYTALPSILIQAQSRLGVTPLQFNILAQLLDYWRDPARAPFPQRLILPTASAANPRPFRPTFVRWRRRGW